MTVGPPPPWSPDDSHRVRSALSRIIALGESAVNEELLNQTVRELADLATAVNRSRLSEPGGVSREASKSEWQAVEACRTAINEVTRALVETLKVENKKHNATFDFRLGQALKPSLLQELRGIVELLRNSLESADWQEHHQILDMGAQMLLEWRDSVMPPLYSELRSDVLNDPQTYTAVISEFLSNQITAAHMQNLNRIEESAAATLEHIDTAAGKVGAKTLARGFVEQRDKESRRAGWWTLGVVFSVVLGIALPVVALTTDKIGFTASMNGTPWLLIKALVGIPLFALAAYFGRISSQHRETERYLRILATQVDTVQAYADVLPEADRAQLILNLGSRAFSDPGFVTADKGNVGPIPDNVIELLHKALDITKESVKRSP